MQKSLVEFEAEAGRYRLLETVRQYATERLDEAGEADATRTRHLRYHVTLMQHAFWKIQGPEQRTWMSRLDSERENLLAALAWCDRAENGGEWGLWLVSALRGYWLHRGLLELGYRVTVEALARPDAPKKTLQRCWALQAAGWLSFWMGNYAKAREFCDESMAVAREIGDKASLTFVLILAGMVCETQGDRAGARAHLEESLALSRTVGNKHQLAQAVHALAELRRAHGDLDAAQPLYEEALALQRQLGDSYECAICLLNLARRGDSARLGGRGADDAARERSRLPPTSARSSSDSSCSTSRRGSLRSSEIGRMPRGSSARPGRSSRKRDITARPWTRCRWRHSSHERGKP